MATARSTAAGWPAAATATPTPAMVPAIAPAPTLTARSPPGCAPGRTFGRGRGRGPGGGGLGLVGGEVGGEGSQVGVGPRRERLADPRVQLVLGQPALDERGLEGVDHVLAIGVRGSHATAARGPRPRLISRARHRRHLLRVPRSELRVPREHERKHSLARRPGHGALPAPPVPELSNTFLGVFGFRGVFCASRERSKNKSSWRVSKDRARLIPKSPIYPSAGRPRRRARCWSMGRRTSKSWYNGPSTRYPGHPVRSTNAANRANARRNGDTRNRGG